MTTTSQPPEDTGNTSGRSRGGIGNEPKYLHPLHDAAQICNLRSRKSISYAKHDYHSLL